MSLSVRAHAAPWNNGVEVLLRDGDSVGTLLLRKIEDGMYCQPTFCMSMSVAQVLMDDLWVAGLRPTEGSGSAGALAATQRHLEDMRRIVFAPEALGAAGAQKQTSVRDAGIRQDIQSPNARSSATAGASGHQTEEKR